MPNAQPRSSRPAPASTRRWASPAEHHDGVVVVGGGYAGLHAVRAVERLGVPVVVVDRRARHDFVTRLAAIAGGTAPPDDAGRPLSEFVDDVIVGSVAGVADGEVQLTDGRRITADAVVVTVGAEPSRPPIDGLEHAVPLRTATDALTLRARIEQAESVVIIGGGASGVQLAGAVAHAHPDIQVHLVEAAPHLLDGLGRALGEGAERILAGRGVELHLGHPVERITPDGVVLDGRHLDGLAVWAGGFRADAAALGVPTTSDGRISVGPDLRIAGMGRTFAAGDVAGHIGGDGRPLPMSAQIAVRAGTAAGRNAARVVLGDVPQRVALRQLGWVLDLGGRRGLAQLGSITLSGPFADLIPPLLHDAIDLKNLVDIGGLAALRFATGPMGSLVDLFGPTGPSDSTQRSIGSVAVGRGSVR